MKRCILHFGMPKTGSTSIQYALANAAPGSSSLECVGFSKKDGTRHGNLTNSIGLVWHDDPSKFRTSRRLGLSAERADAKRDAHRQRLVDSVRNVDGVGLISAEGLCKVLSTSGLQRFGDWLSTFTDSVTAVAYIRTPKSFMESMFQEGLKHGNAQRLNLERHIPRYREWFEKMDTVFGAQNVHFWKFDPKAFPNGDVVQDFCTRLGFKLEVKSYDRRNESLSVGAVRLLFAYRKMGPGFGVGPVAVRENRILVRALSGLPGPKLRLAAEPVARILEERRSDIEWMEERMGDSLREELVDAPEAVRSEEDLLKFDEGSLRWLAEQLGPDHVGRVHPAMTPEDVAGWVHELRLKLFAASPAEPRRKASLAKARKRKRPARQPGDTLAEEDLL